ncbi:MAG: 4Fe-4S binding protein [Coriobacteriales bacterium]|jgi:ech hydrogenase subunit F|nr:4Fe-4S binding protein [Coriobacteriales bacterium]
MGSFHLTKMSFKNLFSKPATKLYPIEPPVYTPMTKGRVVVDMKECTLCSVCEKKCPSSAITVDKPGETWTLNPFACVQCYACVRVCPKDCLTMLADYTPSATKKSLVIEKKPELTPEEKAAKEAKDKEKAERVAAAMAKKAAKDAAAKAGEASE